MAVNPYSKEKWYYLSAYAIAVKHGYKGTEEEWLAEVYGGRDAAAASAAEASEAQEAAEQAQEAAETAQAAAEGSATAAAASATSAQDYAEHIADPVGGIVSTWIEDNLSQETGYVIDKSLLVEDAAADAKATGEAIKAALRVTDEYGSCYSSADERDANLRAAREMPIYTYHFADTQRGHINGSGEFVEGSGCNTMNRPIKYDDSMVLVYKQPNPVTNYYSFIYAGSLDDNGQFVKSWQSAGFLSSAQTINIRAYKSLILDAGGYVAFGLTQPSSESLTFDVVVKSPCCNLIKSQAISLVNDYLPGFVLNENAYVRHYSDRVENTANHGTLLYNRYHEVGPSAKYLYAGGLPIDAEFYRKNPAESGPGDVIQAAVGDFGAINTNTLYPRWIKIPDGCTSYQMAVYGFARPTASTIIGTYLLEFLPEICSYHAAQHSAVPNSTTGNMIRNAKTLCELRYPGNKIYLKAVGAEVDHLVLTPFRVANGIPFLCEHKGVPYGRFSPGVSLSWYTFFSAFRFSGFGTIQASHSTKGAVYGHVCTAFVSAILGMKTVQGTEYWLQTYADKLKPVEQTTVFNVGDIILKQTYHETPDLDTHIRVIIDKLCDEKTGEFLGYVMAESANLYNRITVSKTPGMWSSSANSKAWYLPVPMTSVPLLRDAYRYGIDKRLDPLTNANQLTLPPAVTYRGDHVLVVDDSGDYGGPVSNADWLVAFDPAYTTAVIKKNGTNVAEFNIADLPGYVSYNAYQLGRINGYLDGFGDYELYVGDNNTPCTFRYTTPPVASASSDRRTLTISGMSTFDEVWLKVTPNPVTVGDYTPPYANYVFIQVPQSAINAGTYTLPEKYQNFTQAHFFDNEYGCLIQYFSADDDDD